MPRKGPLELSVVPLPPHQRAPAPKEFSAAEKRIWDEVVGDKKVGWYNASFGALLSAYCTEAAMAQALQAELRKVTLEEQGPRYLRLLREHGRVSKSMCQLATKLRLCPSANRQPREQETRRWPRPWLPDEEPA